MSFSHSLNFLPSKKFRADLCLSLRSPYNIVISVLDSGIAISVFKLQLYYYIHFRTLRKDMNLFIPTSNGLNSTTAVLVHGWLWHWIANGGWSSIKQKNQIIYSSLKHMSWFVTILNSLKTSIFVRLKLFGL